MAGDGDGDISFLESWPRICVMRSNAKTNTSRTGILSSHLKEFLKLL